MIGQKELFLLLVCLILGLPHISAAYYENLACPFDNVLCNKWEVTEGAYSFRHEYTANMDDLNGPADSSNEDTVRHFMLLQRNTSLSARLEFSLSETVHWDRDPPSCLSLRLWAVSGMVLPISIKIGVDGRKQLFWRTLQANIDRWQTIHVPLPYGMQSFIIESEVPELALSSFQVTDTDSKPCPVERKCDFDFNYGCDFKMNTMLGFAIVEATTAHQRQPGLPAIDGTLSSGQGKYLITRPLGSAETEKKSRLISQEIVSKKSANRVYTCVRFKLFKPDRNRHVLNLRIVMSDTGHKLQHVFWSSESNPIWPQWQTVQVQIPYTRNIELMFETLVKTNESISLAIDDLRYTAGQCHSADASEIDFYEFGAFDAKSNVGGMGFLWGSGRRANATLLPDCKWIEAIRMSHPYAYVDFTHFPQYLKTIATYQTISSKNDDPDSKHAAVSAATSLIEAHEQTARIFTLAHRVNAYRHKFCVSTKWYAMGAPEAEFYLQAWVVGESGRYLLFELDELTNGWEDVEENLIAQEDFRLEFVAINRMPAIYPVVIGLGSVSIKDYLCTNKNLHPQPIRIDTISCDFAIDLCGWRNQGSMSFYTPTTIEDKAEMGRGVIASSMKRVNDNTKTNSAWYDLSLKSPLYEPQDEKKIHTYCLNIVYLFRNDLDDDSRLWIQINSDDEPLVSLPPIGMHLVATERNIQFNRRGSIRLTVNAYIAQAFIGIQMISLHQASCHSLSFNARMIDFEHSPDGWFSDDDYNRFMRLPAKELNPALTDRTRRSSAGHVYGYHYDKRLSDWTVVSAAFKTPANMQTVCMTFQLNFNVVGQFKMGTWNQTMLSLKLVHPENVWYQHQAQIEFSGNYHDIWIRTTISPQSPTGFVALDDVFIENRNCPYQDDLNRGWHSIVEPFSYYASPEATPVEVKQLSAFHFFRRPYYKHNVKDFYGAWQMIGKEAAIRTTKFPVKPNAETICLSFDYFKRFRDDVTITFLIGQDGQQSIVKQSYVVANSIDKFMTHRLEGKVGDLQTFVAILMVTTSKAIDVDQLWIENVYLKFGACESIASNFDCNDGSGVHIASQQVCDGVAQCPGKKDELNCGSCSFANHDWCEFQQDHDPSLVQLELINAEEQTVSIGSLQRPPKSFLRAFDDHVDFDIGKSIITTLHSPSFLSRNRACKLSFMYAAENMVLAMQLAVGDYPMYTLWQSGSSKFESKADELFQKSVEIDLGTSTLPMHFQFVFYTQIQFDHNSSISKQATLSSIQMIDCDQPIERDRCQPDQFQCRLTKACVPLQSVCDLVSDCEDHSDEECEGHLYRLSFESEDMLRKHGKNGGFRWPSRVENVWAGPMLDHTWASNSGGFVMMGSRSDPRVQQKSAEMLSMGDVTDRLSPKVIRTRSKECRAFLKNFWISNLGQCELGMSLRSNVSNHQITIETRASQIRQQPDRSVRHVFVANTDPFTWTTYRFDLSAMQVYGQYLLQVQFLLSDCNDWLAVDDVFFSSQCYAQKIDYANCFFDDPDEPLCRWEGFFDYNQPGFGLYSVAKAPNEIVEQIGSNEQVSTLFVFDSTTNRSALIDQVEDSAAVRIISPLLIITDRFATYLKFELLMFGVQSGELRIFQDTFDDHEDVSSAPNSTDRLLLMRVRRQTYHVWQTFYVPLITTQSQFQITIEAHHFGAGSWFSFRYLLLANQKAFQIPTGCVFEMDANCNQLGHYPPINQFDWIASGQSRLPDHTLQSSNGAYLKATPANHRSYQSIRLRSLQKRRQHKITFWYTTWDETEGVVDDSNPANWSDRCNRAAAPRIQVYEAFGPILFEAQLCLRGQWKLITLSVLRPYPIALMITVRFDESNPLQASTHALAIDDLSITKETASNDLAALLHCDFNRSPTDTCAWSNSLDPRHLTWSVTNAFYWAKRYLNMPVPTEYLQQNQLANLLLIEFEPANQLGTQEARLISGLTQLPAGPHCLKIRFSSQANTDISLGIWMQSVVGLIELETIKVSSTEWKEWMVPLRIDALGSTKSNAFELQLVATSGQSKETDWVAIDSIQYEQRECGDQNSDLGVPQEIKLDPETIPESIQKSSGQRWFVSLWNALISTLVVFAISKCVQ